MVVSIDNVDSIDSDDTTHPGTVGRIPMVAAVRAFRRQLFLAQNSRDDLSRLLAKDEANPVVVGRLVVEVALRWGFARSALTTIEKLAVDQHGRAVFEQAKYALNKNGDSLNAVLHRTLLWADGTPLHQIVRQILDGNSQPTDVGTNAQ